MKKLCSLILALTLVMTAGVCAASAETIYIGGIAPVTGAAQQYGNWVKEGVDLYISELNANGGLLGNNVEMIWLDDKGDATEAINAYNSLVSQNIAALIGPVTTTPTLAVAPLAAKDNMPMITASASNADITKAGANVFRACFIDPTQAQLMAKFAVENLGYTKLAVLYDNTSDYSLGLYDAFSAKATELGAEIVATESAVGGDSDYTPQLSKIADAEPEAVLIAYYTEDVAMILNQRDDAGLEAVLLGADGWSGIQNIMTDDLDLLEGCYYADAFSTVDESEATQNFATLYRNTTSAEPVGFNALGYDAAHIICAAIEAAGSIEDKDAIVAAMKATDMDCATSHISYDENNNPIKSAYVMKFVDGQPTLETRVDP